MNDSELKAKLDLERKGWIVLRNGWPDFLCTRTKENGTLEIIGVEIKVPPDELRPEQISNHMILKQAGITVCVYNPEDPDSWNTFASCVPLLKQLHDEVHRTLIASRGHTARLQLEGEIKVCLNKTVDKIEKLFNAHDRMRRECLSAAQNALTEFKSFIALLGQ